MLQLEGLCREANSQAYRTVEVIKLSLVFITIIPIIFLYSLHYFIYFLSFVNICLFVSCRRGSVVAESVVQYNYQNNETVIQFLNTQFKQVLTDFLNDTNNLQRLSQVFGNKSVSLNAISFLPPPVMSKCIMPHIHPSAYCVTYFKISK